MFHAAYLWRTKKLNYFPMSRWYKLETSQNDSLSRSSAAGWMESLRSFWIRLALSPSSASVGQSTSFPSLCQTGVIPYQFPSFFKTFKMARHFVFVLVFSLRNDKVLCAFIDLSTAERAAVQKCNYCTVKEVSVPKYNKTFSILQGQCGVPSPPVTLALNQSFQTTSLHHSYAPF